jgi:hypothetical protein
MGRDRRLGWLVPLPDRYRHNCEDGRNHRETPIPPGTPRIPCGCLTQVRQNSFFQAFAWLNRGVFRERRIESAV